ncbi:MAG: hypothetical protein KIT25_23130 [Enhydrobacter sp.]|nr:MAG: hypothetical protein KIT25_23130 [Enhydrobacter sp.]
MFLRGYRFEHPRTEKSITIRGWSYLWAGLFGAAYVWWIGFGSVWYALLLNVAYGAAFLSIVAVTSFIAAKTQFLVLLVLVPGVILVQGMAMISIIRIGFRRRGWMSSMA